MGHPWKNFFVPPPSLKSQVGGRLWGGGGDLYDIRRGAAAIGEIFGAFREVRGPAGLDRDRQF